MTYIGLQKFISLSQGIDLVKEYATKFNALERYALKDVGSNWKERIQWKHYKKGIVGTSKSGQLIKTNSFM